MTVGRISSVACRIFCLENLFFLKYQLKWRKYCHLLMDHFSPCSNGNFEDVQLLLRTFHWQQQICLTALAEYQQKSQPFYIQMQLRFTVDMKHEKKKTLVRLHLGYCVLLWSPPCYEGYDWAGQRAGEVCQGVAWIGGLYLWGAIQ